MTASSPESSPHSPADTISVPIPDRRTDAEPHDGPAGHRRPVFLRRDRFGAFLSIVLSGQLVYSAFEALKGSLMLQVSDVLGDRNRWFSAP